MPFSISLSHAAGGLQVSGRSSILDFEEVVRLDTEFIENWNLELDIRLIIRTILRVWRDGEAA
ncbi:MAG: sugar transferase [Lachnospiraceae bacterium]|nr:sugar transferase [Lachnospiraceae bacterium]